MADAKLMKSHLIRPSMRDHSNVLGVARSIPYFSAHQRFDTRNVERTVGEDGTTLRRRPPWEQMADLQAVSYPFSPDLAAASSAHTCAKKSRFISSMSSQLRAYPTTNRAPQAMQ